MGQSLHELVGACREACPGIAAYYPPEDLVLYASALLQDKPPTNATYLAKGFGEALLAHWEELLLGVQRTVTFLEEERVFDAKPLREGGTGAKAYAEAVSVYLAFAITRLADRASTICGWDTGYTKIRNTFGRQAIPMTWDFAEGNPFSDSTGNWNSCGEWIWKFVAGLVAAIPGEERQHDAQTVDFPAGTVISTDPPYYDNIGYADLSDFFFCWMKPVMRPVYPSIFGVLATPKSEELVATPYRHGGKAAAEAFFLDGMRKAIANMASGTEGDIPATIYYAFKQSEVAQEGISSTGWATFLQAVVEAGYSVVGTWPLRTEMANRMIASGTNALANSVVLVCRKKKPSAEIVTRAEFIRALKRELPPAIAELQAANIAPADMPQSAIGPGMGVYSRYKAVLESDDSPMAVRHRQLLPPYHQNAIRPGSVV